MLLSELLGERLRAKPAEASLASHIFLLRGGYIRNVGSGIYSLLTPAVRIQKKIEAIIRNEMEKIGGQEVLLPVVIPAELWRKSGRFTSVGSELLRFKDRCDRDMVLAMTHEEAVVHLAKSEAKSYLNYPFMVYQIQTKFRDEPRARGGLIRVREFTMKDAYSFHTTQEDLEQFYNKAFDAYVNIFERIGLSGVLAINSDTGMMGGSGAHEFMLLSEAGEDSIVICENCGYKANMEVAVSEIDRDPIKESPMKKVATPGVNTIKEVAEFFAVPQKRVVKAVVYEVAGSHRPVVVFLRGDLQVNESKLKNHLKAEIKELANTEKFGLVKGVIGPCGDIEKMCDVVFDLSLKGETNMVCGSNEKDVHITGFCVGRDVTVNVFNDISKVEPGHKCVHCENELKISRGVEVGNIFKLGDKYTKTMEMTYVNKDGKEQTPLMGCYGIGIGRVLACVVENSHDDFGPIWPKSITPWQVHICALNMSQEPIKQKSFELYDILSQKYEVLMDDRNLAAGAQFADADLMGIPVRVVVSKRNVEENSVEVSLRGSKNSEKMSVDELVTFLDEFYK